MTKKRRPQSTTPLNKKPLADINNLTSQLIEDNFDFGSANQSAKDAKDSWRELNDIYRQCQVLIASVTEVRVLLSDADATSRLKDKDTVEKNANILLKDIQRFMADLERIRSRHAVEPESNDAWDNFTALEIGEEYFKWMDQFREVAVHTAGEIMAAYSDLTPVESE